MSAVAKALPTPRYGSVAELASYAGLSPKTIRRLIESGAIRGLKVGRRVLIPFDDVDGYLLGRSVRPVPVRQPAMAAIHRTTGPDEADGLPYVPPLSPEDLARRNRDAAALLDSWEAEGDADEQRETMAVLREALGPGRTLSRRALFP